MASNPLALSRFFAYNHSLKMMKLSEQEKQTYNGELRRLLGNYKDTELVNALMDDKSFTKNGRLNKSGVCRFLDAKSKDVSDRLQALQTYLVARGLAI